MQRNRIALFFQVQAAVEDQPQLERPAEQLLDLPGQLDEGEGVEPVAAQRRPRVDVLGSDAEMRGEEPAQARSGVGLA